MKRCRIGLTAVHSDIDYPHSLRMGVQNTIEEAGHTLVAIADLIPYHTLGNSEPFLRVAHEIAARLNLDAVIVPVGCMTAFLSGDSEKALEIMRVMDPASTIVLERKVPGYRCITKDNTPGMHECMRHLIEECGFTKIAFISGPAASHGAHERETVYFEEMAAHGLEVAPSLFARGDFGGKCADVIEKVLDDNPDLEAIACACDLIAYTAYSVLRQRNLAVGEDIAVTGFDDNPRSAHLDPPLSTVHMTSYDYGCVAAREAIRLCEGKPQAEEVFSSTFVARNSCGETMQSGVTYFRELLRQKPFPADTFVSIMLDSTLHMAGKRVTEDFRRQMGNFLSTIRKQYLNHVADPTADIRLFSSHDLTALFAQDYHEHLSLEGFHSVAITLLEALMEESPEEDAGWVIEQISHLHLRIARLLSSDVRTDALAKNQREWITYNMVDSALKDSRDPGAVFRLILEEVGKLGISEADLFLLPDPVAIISGRPFAFSDTLQPVGSLSSGAVETRPDSEPIVLQQLLDQILDRYPSTSVCTVGGIIAGNELLGVAAIDNGTLDLHGQLMAFLNLGLALKHLQLIGSERELNTLLVQNNQLLEEQAQTDAMTGLLNRRGFTFRLGKLLNEHVGESATAMYLDLDGLKFINDTFGHDAGDDAIRETARILRSVMPETNLLTRLGGDEFVMVMLNNGSHPADRIVKEIQTAMDGFNTENNAPFELSISVGAVSFVIDEETPDRISDLMVQADENLYEMKRSHKASRRGSSEREQGA